MKLTRTALALCVLLTSGNQALGQEPSASGPADAPQQAQAQPQAGAPSAADLAKQLSNPVASLVSVPFQFNWDQPVGPYDDSRFVMNVQPVIPLSLNSDWNLILRWIMPFIGQPPLAEGGLPVSGMGDIVASMFFSPAKVGKLIWGQARCSSCRPAPTRPSEPRSGAPGRPSSF